MKVAIPEAGNHVNTDSAGQLQTHTLETKLAMSVSKVLGVTPLVKTLDKAWKVLHNKDNCNNRYYQNKCKGTSACVQTQVSVRWLTRNRKVGERICHQAWYVLHQFMNTLTLNPEKF